MNGLSLESAIAFINASLAPAVLLTGVGLLLAGLQAKYSTIVAVIRQLNAERRGFAEDRGEVEQPTVVIMSSQIESLMRRAKLIRNAVCSLYLTIFFLVLSSILIGLEVLGFSVGVPLIFGVFAVALATLFSGVALAAREALLSFQIVQMETKKWTY